REREVTTRIEARDKAPAVVFEPAFDGELEAAVAVFGAAGEPPADFLAAAVRDQRQLARQRQGFILATLVEAEFDDAALHRALCGRIRVRPVRTGQRDEFAQAIGV